MSTIFVFGSNLKGIHGAGAAKYARENYGAELGCGKGRTGNSYAIPTKITPYETLPLEAINVFVNEFIKYAVDHPKDEFILTAIGCGLAGYNPEQIAPMFSYTPSNVTLPREFVEVLYDG